MRMLSPFVDLRLKKNGELFFKRMIERKTVIIKRLVNGVAEKKRFERWIRHEDVTAARLINTEKSRLADLVEGRHILGIQDTTEINYQNHDGRAHGLGTLEQVFRTLKSKGLNIEESQIESGNNLMKLAILGLCAAIQIMQLISGRDGTTDLKTNDTFTADEQLFLTTLLKKVEGKTQKQQNPHPKSNIAWASWIIARLGGWHCYAKSEGPPGPIVMGRGLKRFYEMFDGWNLYRDLSTG